jgi:predicted nuclease of restriction endonuclease-like (RecB) superfamily
MTDSLLSENLFEKIVNLVESSRKQVASAVNLTMVYTYFQIGKMIVEEEQSGRLRAEYAKYVLKDLSLKLSGKFGKGFSERNLRNMRQFFIAYAPSQIQQTSPDGLQITEKETDMIWQKASAKWPQFTLGWSHYLILMRIENLEERRFYEIEALNQQWSEPELSRQYHSNLYQRLALSRNKEELLRLSLHGQIIEKASDIIKNPLTLEFLGLQEKPEYSELDLESAILGKLQNFLLELGKGFLFEARQKRFSFDEEHFFVDLVFYNRLLQCYVLIDLKTDKLVHQDLGQMQMYVNYYDRFVKLPHEKPTIGILLCKEKKDTLVKLTLPKYANIYASEYSLYLPDKTILQDRLKQWIREFENQ